MGSTCVWPLLEAQSTCAPRGGGGGTTSVRQVLAREVANNFSDDARAP